jgi:hypothetical protein
MTEIPTAALQTLRDATGAARKVGLRDGKSWTHGATTSSRR